MQIRLTYGTVPHKVLLIKRTLELTYEEKQMTRKDYVLIARNIEQAYYLDDTQRNTIAQDLADSLSMDNPRFDRARFLTACGVK